MNKLITTLVASSLFLTFNASAATITFPSSMEVMGVNGQQAKFGQTVDVKTGRQLIMLKYREMLPNNYIDGSWFTTSDNLYFYTDLNNDTDYHVSLPKIHSEDDAHCFLAKPSLTLTNHQGDSQNVELMSSYQLMSTLIL